MAETTNIEWTDATWQIVTGCSVLSPGCTNCYAMKLAGTRLRNHHSRKDLTKATKAGPVWNGMVRFNVGWLHQPLTWRKPRDIFVAAHGDLFHEAVQRWMLVKVFAVMAMAHWHRFQVLTKRADRMREFVTWLHTEEGQWEMARAIEELGIRRFYTWPLPNVWLGVSIEDRERMYKRANALALTPAAVRFWSAEPLLEDLGDFQFVQYLVTAAGSPHAVDQIIVGGESGPRSRPFMLSWASSIVRQCEAMGIACFVKQLGAEAYDDTSYVGSTPRFETKDKKGGNMAEWPPDLRVREFPRSTP